MQEFDILFSNFYTLTILFKSFNKGICIIPSWKSKKINIDYDIDMYKIFNVLILFYWLYEEYIIIPQAMTSTCIIHPLKESDILLKVYYIHEYLSLSISLCHRVLVILKVDLKHFNATLYAVTCSQNRNPCLQRFGRQSTNLYYLPIGTLARVRGHGIAIRKSLVFTIE